MLNRCIFWMILYGVIGWIYETCLCSITERRFVNRGFLNGPYCPIYGFGAVLVVLLLGWIQNPILLFFAGAVLTCTLEYFTSWLMERIFHARWWDYSDRKCQLNGRVCLAGALVFGILSVVVVKWLHPLILRMTDAIPDKYFNDIVLLLFGLLVADFVFTVTKLQGFHQKLHTLHEHLRQDLPNGPQLRQELQHKMEQRQKQVSGTLRSFSERLNSQERRTLKSFSRFRPQRHMEDLQKLREVLKNFKRR